MSDYEKYLFRGKEKNSGEWIYGDLRHISDSHGGYILCIVDNTNGRNNDVTGIEVSPNTVGQYTGVTDKNSTKIFEGDIIESVSRLVNSVGTPTGGTSRYCEVIGNIYDNSELLEDGEEDD